MLSVEDDGVDAALQKRHAVVNDLEVLLLRDAQVVAHVQFPRLPENRDHRRLRPQQHREVVVVAGLDVGPPGGAEGTDAGLFQVQAFHRLEEGFIARIRSRPAALDVTDAEVIQTLRDAYLVLYREGDILRLRPITQRGVIDLDVLAAAHAVASSMPSSIRAWCSTRTASSAYLASITTETLISEVE